jgi:hypothetical protein
MSEAFRIESPPLDVEALSLEVERKARPGPDDPPARDPRQGLLESQSSPGSPVDALLASLTEDADAAQGFPPQSHRKLGAAVVAAKKGFRLALQPFINETFARQNLFNRRLLDTIAALHAENRALATRLERLEAGLARESTEP